MPKPLIHFDDSQLAFFERMLDFTNQHFGALIVPLCPIMNETSGPGLALVTSLSNVKSFLDIVLKFSPTQMEQRSQFLISDARLQELNKELSKAQQPLLSKEQAYRGFYSSLNVRYAKAFSSCSYIITALDEYKKVNAISNIAAYHQVMGYFTLFACVLAYNSCVILQDHQHLEEVNILIKTVRKWLSKFELEHLPHCQDENFRALHDTFFANFQKFRQQQLSQDEHITLSVDNLTDLVQRKNVRAQQFGAPFDGSVIFNPTSKATETLCPNALSKLVEHIIALQHEQPQRKQFLFYPGYHLGDVEVFDVAWDAHTSTFNIINIHSADNLLQHTLLEQLCARLKQEKLNFKIVACQSKLQRYDEDPTCLYAYALSGIVSKLSFDKLQSSPFLCPQPRFLSYKAEDAVAQKTLEEVNWVTLSAFGPKALLMTTPQTAGDFQQLLCALRTLCPDENITELLRNAKRKYGIELDPTKPTVSYVQSLLKRMQQRFAQMSDFSLESVMATLGASTLPQALRRATLFANTDTFEYLISQVRDMSIDDIPVVDIADETAQKHFTPLHLAMRADKDTRAAKLLVLGHAKTDLKDDTESKQTPQDIYDSAKEDSALKRNPVLKLIMGGF